MADLGHDAVYVEETAALRPRLQRCARVLYPGLDGDVTQADRAVDEALARTYALPPHGDRTIAAFRGLLHPRWRPGRPQARGSSRIELLDVSTPVSTAGLADDLAALGPTSQAVVVMALIGGLDADVLATVLAAPRSRVEELFRDAVERLARTDPGRRDLSELTRQLDRLAGPQDHGATAQAAVGDLQRGQHSVRRGRVRRGALIAAAMVVMALVTTVAIRAGTPREAADLPPTPSPTPSYVSDPWQSYRCNPTDNDCRTIRTARWRSRMATVIVQHLDPEHRYFTEMGYGLRSRVDGDSFWTGDDGALEVNLYRQGDGATTVYLQIATSRRAAVGCGDSTGQRCQAITFMNGNRFLIGGTNTGSGGVEVQYYADVDAVITVAAKNSGSGKRLDLGSADLVQLVSDTRLRLPQR
ncbi:MAG TPA: hypothetical protein VFP34_08600 [Microlunatus sp.]|nr:hypothetical protein [Microlunatus sp.]